VKSAARRAHPAAPAGGKPAEREQRHGTCAGTGADGGRPPVEPGVGRLDARGGGRPGRLARERLHAQRMLALYRSARQAEALEAYRHAGRVLVAEIGIEPGPELRGLHDAILRQDPVLDAPARAATLVLPLRAPRRTLALADASRLHSTAIPDTNYLFLNVREPPFDDVKVRRALNLAIDRSRVVELVGGAVFAASSCQIIPPGLAGYVPTCPYTRSPRSGVRTGADLARARRLVTASGTRGMHVDVRGIDIPLAPLVRYAARMLRELGHRSRARLTPDINGHFEFVNDSRNHAQIGFYGWIADYLTPSSFIEWAFTCRRLIPRSSTNLNASQFCDAKVDRA
jgi:Bacterial transcriptional activator domain/Bacterial extracellular solute-binding proteins, family 5 Middle